VSEHQNECTAPRFAFREDTTLTRLSLYATPIREHKQVSRAGKEAGWSGRQCIQPRKSSCKSSRSSYQWYARSLKCVTSSPANLLNRPLAKTLALVRTRPSFPLSLFGARTLTMASVVIPCLILGSINAWNLWNEHWEHWSHMPPLEERVEYPYQNLRTRNFFWGDGDKVSMFR
jgi:Cytochrome c oxidase subunit VIa